MLNGLLHTVQLDITVLAAIAGYTAVRFSIHIDKGFLPKPVIFLRHEMVLTGFAYLGVGYVSAAILTSLIVNPWWTVLFILFFTVVLSEFVIIPLLKKHTYIFSIVLMLLSVYFYLEYIF